MENDLFTMNFQKQLDTVTGALNIFDMSYLVSGAAMLMVLVYAFPEVRAFVFHENQITLSVFVCIIVTYIIGLLSWILGKQICDLKNKKHTVFFQEQFDEYFTQLPQDDTKISLLRNMGRDMAFSYMWMKLDKSEDDNCRSRYLYISRFWVMRAVYEGLIPSVIVLAIVVCFKVQNIAVFVSLHTNCWLKMVILSLINTVAFTWIANILLVLVIFALMILIVYCLEKEAEKCVKTQVREVMVAYYDFYIQNNVPETTTPEMDNIPNSHG